MSDTAKPLDAVKNWVDLLPGRFQPFARLSRFDRPIGFWLLGLPCWMGVTFGALTSGNWQPEYLFYLLMMAVGAIAMRGAGCTYNDIVDKDLDAEVERTAQRPIPAGDVSVKMAWGWLGAQLAVGFVVWLLLPLAAKVIALFSIPMVMAYPYMKRITWWPQAWLGMTFNWGFPVGFVAANGVGIIEPIIFYLGLIAWTIGYDTLYARQDVEDDTLIGIKSTARLFGEHTLPAVMGLYALSGLLVGTALSYGGPRMPGVIIALAFLGHLIWQVTQYKARGDSSALYLFKSNRQAGLLVVFGLLVTIVLSQ